MIYSGDKLIFEGSHADAAQLPDLPWEECDRLVFNVVKGVRAHVEEVAFTGLQSIPEAEARSYFVPSGGLFVSKASRAYAPLKLESQLRTLRLRLGQLGYQDAVVKPLEPPGIGQDGEVSLRIHVDEGPKFIWGAASCKRDAATGVGRHAAPQPAWVFATARHWAHYVWSMPIISIRGQLIRMAHSTCPLVFRSDVLFQIQEWSIQPHGHSVNMNGYICRRLQACGSGIRNSCTFYFLRIGVLSQRLLYLTDT